MGFPELTYGELVLRLGLACACGAIVGFEREWRDRSAGFRTHILVCVGAAVFTIISGYGFSAWYENVPNELRPNVMNDPSRVAAQVVTGIGFLGAGAIFQSRGSVKGLTTAASLWAMAAIGMAVGVGNYEIALTTTALIVFILTGLRVVSHRIKRLNSTERAAMEVRVNTNRALGAVFDAVHEHGAKLAKVRTSLSTEDGAFERVLMFDADLAPQTTAPELLGRIAAVDGVVEVTVIDVESA